MPKATRFEELFHHRWTVPVLAELQRTSGAKFVTLVHRLSVNRGALRQTLDAAIRNRLVKRNPGYGHPLRPEYILTSKGAALAGSCVSLMDLLRSRGLERVVLRKWSAAVLVAVGRGLARFGQLQSAATGISDRALALTLKRLQAAGLLRRQVRDAYPPLVEYRLTARAAPLADIAARLALI